MKNVTSRTNKTLLNTLFGIINRFCNIILSFVLRTVFIWTLGIQYTGVSSVFSDILNVLSLSELGISTAISAALFKPLHDKDYEKVNKLMNFYKKAYRLVAAFILIVGLILLPFITFLIKEAPDIKESLYIIFFLYIVKTSLSYLLIYKTTILIADQRQFIVKGMETICTFIKYVVEVIVLMIFKDFVLYLLLEIIFTVIQNIIITRRAAREYPHAFSKNNAKLEKKDMKSLFKDIKGLSMYQISGTIGNSIDNILVSSFIGTSIVGILSNYTLIRRQIEAILLQFFNSLTPSIGNLVAEGDIEKQYSLFNNIFYVSFFVINFCAVSLFILFNPFIKIWLGNKYLLSETISFVIAFDFLLYMTLQAISSFRTANGLFVKGQYRPLITAILNVILSILLISKYGIFGTILATIICRIITQWYDPFILFKCAFKKPFRNFYLRYWIYICLFLTSSGISYCLYSFINLSPFLNFLLSIVICLIVPNALVLLTTCKTEEFKYMCDFFNRRLFSKVRRKRNV